MIIVAIVGAFVALFWPSAKPPAPPATFALGVHPAPKRTAEVEAHAALGQVKTFLLDRGVAEDEVNAAIAPLLIHFTPRGT